jgi:hypothetical protein
VLSQLLNGGAFSATPGAPGSTKPNMNDRNAMGARRRGDVANVLGHVLRFRMARRSGCSKGAALAHRVVLHVLNDEDCAPWVEIQPLPRCGGRGRVVRGGVGSHVRLDPRADLGRQAIDRVRRRDEQRAQFGAAPGEIGHHLGDMQLPDQLA